MQQRSEPPPASIASMPTVCSANPATRAALAAAGFVLHTVGIDAIEAGGGSLRCCIGEVY